jgi:large conductance mechanosensitive channel
MPAYRREVDLSMSSLTSEFKAFISKGNVIDLAVAVVIGAAFGKIVTAVVEGILMPVLGAAMPSDDWTAWTVSPWNLRIGQVLGAVVDFVVIAAVVFLIFVKGGSVLRRREAVEPTATKQCPECLEMIPIDAHKCRACTSAQPTVAASAALAQALPSPA